MKTSLVSPGKILCLALLFASPLRAQDTRIVTEPKVPPTCTILNAQLTTASGQTLAEADETKTDTTRIQNALDHCPAGQAVKLASTGQRNAFLSGPLQLRSGVTLLVDAGAILFASRNPRDYDVSPGSCGLVDKSGKGCKPLIGGDRVRDAAVMGDGTIDGRGGSNLIGQNVSWWDLAQEAKVKDANQNCPRILVLTRSENFTLYRITLKNSPNFHVVFGGNGFTAWGVIINAPKTARNTDGIDPINATNVTIAHSFINAGDDQIVVKANGDGPTSHITVAHNHFYAGHGMSIGSETDGGVSAVRVTDLSIDGSDNGLRIKSNNTRGGLVRDVVYEDVCIRDTKNPIFMDTHYTASYSEARNKIPRYQDITLRNVRILSPGKITLDGHDESRRLGMTFDNVVADTPESLAVTATHARVNSGPGPMNFSIAGSDVRVEGQAGQGPKNSCEAKFVPMPDRGSVAAKPVK